MNDKFKKIRLAILLSIIACGASINVYNALNDYGLATAETLHSAIIAQSTGTGGSSSGGNDGESTGPGGGGPGVQCDGHAIRCQQTLQSCTETLECVSDANGELSILGIKLFGYKANTQYKMSVEHRKCEDCKSERNVCFASEQGYFLISVNNGSSTQN